MCQGCWQSVYRHCSPALIKLVTLVNYAESCIHNIMHQQQHESLPSGCEVLKTRSVVTDAGQGVAHLPKHLHTPRSVHSLHCTHCIKHCQRSVSTKVSQYQFIKNPPLYLTTISQIISYAFSKQGHRISTYYASVISSILSVSQISQRTAYSIFDTTIMYTFICIVTY